MRTEYKNYSWKKNKLYYFDKDTGLQIGPDQEHPELWRFGYNNYLSDIFNKTRVKDNAVKYMIEEYSKTLLSEPLRSPVDAMK